MKSTTSIIMRDTLFPPNLSHMDFLDDPAAIHRCRLIISRAKQDASPNDCRNPEMLKRNHHRNIHSFLGSWPAIFPDTAISSCVCIVLLFETSSSSHICSGQRARPFPLRGYSSLAETIRQLAIRGMFRPVGPA